MAARLELLARVFDQDGYPEAATETRGFAQSLVERGLIPFDLPRFAKGDREHPLAVFIRDARNGLDLSQEEFARRGNMSLAMIQKIEQGRAINPSARTIARLVRALELGQEGFHNLINTIAIGERVKRKPRLSR